jgi:hypothetical protein
MAQILSFDIEIANVFELRPGDDLDRYGPFDISVAATGIDGEEEVIWLSSGPTGKPRRRLSRRRATELLNYLDERQRAGDMLCAWNGLGFDFKWLGHAARNPELAGVVALRSFDPMFQFFNQRGFPVGLAKVAEAMGIVQTKLMSGADAPRRWAAGDHEAVIEYVKGDVQMTTKVVRAIKDLGRVSWVTQRGTPCHETLPVLKPAIAVLDDPLPDQSWMSDPIPRTKFHSWIPRRALKLAAR